jgi:transcriptional regulator CtsR
MRNISDIIEQYLKNILHGSPDGSVEIGRNELAEQFQCVPSQINYVISTRFSLEKGYIVESKRGGGGYVRIRKIEIPGGGVLSYIFNTVRDAISQDAAEGLIMQLLESGHIDERIAKALTAAVSRESLRINLPHRDRVRAQLLKNMLVALLSHDNQP